MHRLCDGSWRLGIGPDVSEGTGFDLDWEGEAPRDVSPTTRFDLQGSVSSHTFTVRRFSPSLVQGRVLPGDVPGTATMTPAELLDLAGAAERQPWFASTMIAGTADSDAHGMEFGMVLHVTHPTPASIAWVDAQRPGSVHLWPLVSVRTDRLGPSPGEREGASLTSVKTFSRLVP